jgi:hypothetical protein
MDFPAASGRATSAVTCLPAAISRGIRWVTGPARPAERALANIKGNTDPTASSREEVVTIANFQEASR